MQGICFVYLRSKKASDCGCMMEIDLISGAIFRLIYIDHITIGGLILSENAN